MIRRVAIQAIPTIFGIVALNFLLLNLMPGDAADAIAGMSGSATVETMEVLRKTLGLDRPSSRSSWDAFPTPCC
jgi:peptide/nickel transport system permease protein